MALDHSKHRIFVFIREQPADFAFEEAHFEISPYANKQNYRLWKIYEKFTKNRNN